MNAEEFQKLSEMADTAEECLYSLRFGSHYFLVRYIFQNYGVRTDKLGAIKEARRLCREYLDELKYAEMGDKL